MVQRYERPCERPVHGRRRGPGRSTGGHHVRVNARGRNRPSAITGGDAWSLGRVRAIEQGSPPTRRPADRRGDRPCDAASTHRAHTRTNSWSDRDPVACGLADQRGSRADRVRSRLEDRVGAGSRRQGREATDGRHGRLRWEHVARWTEHRAGLPIGPLFCILAGPTRGRGWSPTAARGELRRLAVEAGVRRRFAPHH